MIPEHYEPFQASAAIDIKSSLSWDVTLCRYIQTYQLNRSVPSLRDKQSQEVVPNRREISISLLLPTRYRTWPTCFSVCSQRQFSFIYCDVSNSSALVPHTLLTSVQAQQPIHYPVCLVVEAIGRRPTPWTEWPPQSACTPFTEAQYFLAVQII